MVIGDIIYLKNIIFEINFCDELDALYVDHCNFNGRPCIYAGQIKDKMYFIPLTSTNRFLDFDVCINANKSNRLLKPSYLVLNNIICREHNYYCNKGFINEEEMYNIFNKFMAYFEKYIYSLKSLPNMDELYMLAIQYVERYEKTKANCKTKRCKKKG